MVKLSLFRIMKWPTLWLYHPPWHHPLTPAWRHSLPTASPLRAPRVGLPVPVLAQAPMSPAGPPPPSGHPAVGPLTPEPRQTPGPAQNRSALLLPLSSALALAVIAAWAAGRPYIHLGGSGLEIFAQCPECGGGSQISLKKKLARRGKWGVI